MRCSQVWRASEHLRVTKTNDMRGMTAPNQRGAGGLNPFERLRCELDQLHPQGCRKDHVARGRPMPLGTFRRMYSSAGLVHADTGALLARHAGEFSANIYIRTPPGRGSLNIYPAQQYSMAELPQIYALNRAQLGSYNAACSNCEIEVVIDCLATLKTITRLLHSDRRTNKSSAQGRALKCNLKQNMRCSSA